MFSMYSRLSYKSQFCSWRYFWCITGWDIALHSVSDDVFDVLQVGFAAVSSVFDPSVGRVLRAGGHFRCGHVVNGLVDVVRQHHALEERLQDNLQAKSKTGMFIRTVWSFWFSWVYFHLSVSLRGGLYQWPVTSNHVAFVWHCAATLCYPFQSFNSLEPEI